MNIFTPVWGYKNQKLLKTALGKCLSWPKNKAAVKDSTWHIVTDSEESANEAWTTILGLGIGNRVSFYISPLLKRPDTDKGVLILTELLKVIEACIATRSPLLMATPDFIYGDGTIDAFKRIGNKPGSCVAIPHIRVCPEITEALALTLPPTNSFLVGLAIKNAHISWTDSEDTSKDSRTYRSAIMWRKLKENIFSVQHIMPSPFFVNFLREDIDYLKIPHDNRLPGFGAWDHKWPKFLIEQGRLRIIGSSDVAVMAEVTDFDMNVPPLDPPNKPMTFFNNDFHNHIQKQFVSIFRSEG